MFNLSCVIKTVLKPIYENPDDDLNMATKKSLLWQKPNEKLYQKHGVRLRFYL